MFDSMPLLTVWMVIAVGLFVTSAAFFSFTGNRDAFHVHPTPQMWTASKLFCHLWKNSRLCAVSINGSKSDLGYAVGHVCCEDNESSHLVTCQVANGNRVIFLLSLRVKLRVWKCFQASCFYNQLHSEHTWLGVGGIGGWGVLPRILVGLCRKVSWALTLFLKGFINWVDNVN